ncbi:hypothetical protein ACRRTK_006355 [Alexandromys fortis]
MALLNATGMTGTLWDPGKINSRRPSAPLAAAAETNWALRSVAAQGSVEGRSLRETRPPTAGQCPRGRSCDLPTAPTCTRRGPGCLTSDGSRRQRTALRGSAHPGGDGKPDVELRAPPPRATGYVTGRGRSRDGEGGPAALPPLVLRRRRSPEDHWPLHHVAPPSLTPTPPSWERARPAAPGSSVPKVARAGCRSAGQLIGAESPLRACVDAGRGFCALQ